MVTTNVETRVEETPTEEFSFSVFRFLERKMRVIRGMVMRDATKLAADEAGDSPYRVSEEHINRALSELLDRADFIKYQTGLTKTDPSTISEHRADSDAS
jgi:hypothetical protein